jgi:multiple sugar transport system permease protein
MTSAVATIPARSAAGERARRRRRLTRGAYRVARVILLILLLVWILAPFYFLLLVSFQSKADSLSTPPNWFPIPDISNYTRILGRFLSDAPISGPPDLILPGIRNSAIVATATGLINVLLGAMAGYAFARIRFPGSRKVPSVLLATQMVPAFALLVPYYVVLRQLGLTNTLQGVIVAEVSITLPFTIWLLRSYFQSIPIALERAARTDGCSRWQTFYIVVLPLARPGLIAVGLFAFMVAWNDFLFAVILNNRTSEMLIQPAIAGLYNVREQSFGIMAAGSLLAAIPTMLLVLFLQRFLVRGILSGATKG